MKSFSKILIALALTSVVVIVVSFSVYSYSIGPVSDNKDTQEFIVSEKETYLTLTSKLKEKNLIKSEIFYKIYVKLHDIPELQAGKYQLSESMGVKQILNILGKGSTYNPNVIKITLREGVNLNTFAAEIAPSLSYSKEELLKAWNKKSFLDEVISKYWFVTDEIKKKGIVNALEGYFYPATYELSNKDVTPEEIAYKLLDQMELVLKEYKTDIENSNFTVHEFLSLAAIIEGESPNAEERKNISGVFHNRLEKNMLLQSCVTLEYVTGVHKNSYSSSDMKIDSPYNTYLYEGVPIGPGISINESSIIATLHPNKHEYYYFQNNPCEASDKNTYYSRTYEQHLSTQASFGKC